MTARRCKRPVSIRHHPGSAYQPLAAGDIDSPAAFLIRFPQHKAVHIADVTSP